MIAWLSTNRERFPPVGNALAEPNGLLAAGGDLSSERLIAAYRRGIFPWYSAGQPILWWSPDPRMVLFPAELRISRSLRKTLAKRGYHIRTDACFEDVMQGCAGQRAGREETWITPEMVAAYTALHERGLAHSVETWIDGELAGGLYGVALGRVFYGESMFTRVADASKIALVHLAVQLARWGYGVIDCQMKTAHLARFGAREIARAEFVRRLAELVNYPGITGRWRFDDDLLE